MNAKLANKIEFLQFHPPQNTTPNHTTLYPTSFFTHTLPFRNTPHADTLNSS